MEKVLLNANIRDDVGKEANKRLRREGGVPVVLYKKGKTSLSLKVDVKDLYHVLHTSAGENVILTLKVKADSKDAKATKDRTVIIKEIQHHPIKENILHVDFHEISLTEMITVRVPVETKGEAEGVKADGGVLDQVTKEIEVECLPTEIPDKIEVHVGPLKIGDAIRVKDLTVPAQIKVLSDPELTVLSVVPPHVEKEEEEAAEEITEPEVIKEKKPEAEGAAPEAAEGEETKE